MQRQAICRKYYSNMCYLERVRRISYQYPISSSLSELRMNNDFAFYATGVDNFSALFVKSIFAKDSSALFKVWVTHVLEHVR